MRDGEGRRERTVGKIMGEITVRDNGSGGPEARVRLRKGKVGKLRLRDEKGNGEENERRKTRRGKERT